MSLINTWKFTKTIILWDVIANATHNQFRVVSVKNYSDTKNKVLPDGFIFTLQVLRDDYNYGTNKNGEPLENNTFQNFDVTVLNRNHPIKKGDYVRLLEFDSEHSFAIGFDLILRFKDYEVIQKQTPKN